MAVPDWVVYPEEEWPRLTPAQAGFREPEFDQVVSACRPRPAAFWGEVHAPYDVGAVLTRGGYLVHSWGRSADYRYQTASVGKAFARAALGLAVEKLGLNPHEPVCRTWTGAGRLTHPHQHFDTEAHREITWQHLVEHEAGFAIENGYFWRRREIPDEPWIGQGWTGNPVYDMRSLRAPGTRFYSSANYVRLGQALTALWGMDLKVLLDTELFGRMGIPAERWHWMSLREVYQAYDLYPATPGFGHYADPPWEINGAVVRGAPGWVCMSAEDLARFGLLVASGGEWAGERLLGSEWVISKSGGNSSTMVGDSETMVAGGRVATENLPDFLWVPDFVEYRFPRELIDPDVIPGKTH